MKRAYIAFGANLANPADMLLRVIEALALSGLRIDAVSPLYRSPAWPAGSGAPDYLNAVLAVRTTLGASALLDRLLMTETQLGRRRSVRNAPRVVDLDLIDFAGETLETPHLSLPHPRMADRAFVLLPLQDVAREWVHPDGRHIRYLVSQIDRSETQRVRG